MSLWGLFKLFFRIGATGFGGMMSLLGLVEQQVVQRRKLVSAETMAEGLAVGQILPGPVVVDLITYIGYRLRGWLGGLLSAVAVITPAFLLLLVISPLYFIYNGDDPQHQIPRLAGAFTAIGGAVIAVVAAATYRVGKTTLKDWGEMLFALVGCLAYGLLKVSPIAIILAAGVVGMIFWRPAGNPQPNSRAVSEEAAPPAEEPAAGEADD